MSCKTLTAASYAAVTSAKRLFNPLVTAFCNPLSTPIIALIGGRKKLLTISTITTIPPIWFIDHLGGDAWIHLCRALPPSPQRRLEYGDEALRQKPAVFARFLAMKPEAQDPGQRAAGQPVVGNRMDAKARHQASRGVKLEATGDRLKYFGQRHNLQQSNLRVVRPPHEGGGNLEKVDKSARAAASIFVCKEAAREEPVAEELKPIFHGCERRMRRSHASALKRNVVPLLWVQAVEVRMTANSAAGQGLPRLVVERAGPRSKQSKKRTALKASDSLTGAGHMQRTAADAEEEAHRSPLQQLC